MSASLDASGQNREVTRARQQLWLIDFEPRVLE
jgi:hypothetical protein